MRKFLEEFFRNFVELSRKFEETKGSIEKVCHNCRKLFREIMEELKTS